ncbi:hypothetical protein [Desulforamulus hydrothermalis]|uniref:Uncharacterized protein n=1 Tax=Desulforamulus hydrothermalis Lam5 = DSM 18033 TaxID=1121428 RepID=K8DX54_9FIRM|nr:hypothetical protein [Desulforamulus hydrothermalis]CCO07137.1 conserved hypothetical protein [Desulforamulus hydrothermalis Lam5 = DSM 18033]SHG89273.1 hypothetical protein SAMN02745177_00734 [Desulforamulus hydrothermalis Lam5 = DSM 18033]
MAVSRCQVAYDRLAYFRPVYLPDGDGTEIAYEQGNIGHDLRNVRSVRKAVCRYFALDYTALRKMFRRQGGVGLPPLSLAPGYTLAAVKTRTARCAGDPCYGFIHLQSIQEVREAAQEDKKTLIVLKNGLSIGSVSSLKTVKQALLLADHMTKNCQYIKQNEELVAQLFYRIIKLLEKENPAESRIF